MASQPDIPGAFQVFVAEVSTRWTRLYTDRLCPAYQNHQSGHQLGVHLLHYLQSFLNKNSFMMLNFLSLLIENFLQLQNLF